MKFLTFAAFLTLVALPSGFAERDSNVYGSYSNPNAVYNHYWAKPQNVYQDLSSFKKIYVKYHHCTWSPASYTINGEQCDDDGGQDNQENEQNYYYDGQDNNGNNNDGENNQNNNENDGQNNQNNGENNNNGDNNNNNENENNGDNNNNNQDNNNNENQDNNNENQDNNEDQDNQAGRLRFLPEGDEGGGWSCGIGSHQCEHGGGNWYMGLQPCMGANVAYSLYGILDGATDAESNPCNKENFVNSFFTTDGLTTFAYASNGNVDTSNLYQQCTENGDYAYSTGCSSTGTFTMDTFNGHCTSNNYYATTDSLSSLNSALGDMSCVLVYSSDGSIDLASDLLAQSVECSVNLGHGKSCPDPHGLLTKYEYNFSKAQKYSNGSFMEKHGKTLTTTLSFVFIVSSIALLVRRYQNASTGKATWYGKSASTMYVTPMD